MENPPPANAKRVNVWARVATILISVAIAVAIFLLRDRLAEFAHYGLPGLFAISLLSNATLILPAPGLAFVFAMGSILDPLAVGAVAAAGGALGEMTGYLAGYAGSAVIEDRRRYDQIQYYMERHGLLVILVLAILPNPFFDLAGIAAGAMKLPVWKFLGVAYIGKFIKNTAVALAGAGSAGMFEALIRTLMQ